MFVRDTLREDTENLASDMYMHGQKISQKRSKVARKRNVVVDL
jgi:hypothetical protein